MEEQAFHQQNQSDKREEQPSDVAKPPAAASSCCWNGGVRFNASADVGFLTREKVRRAALAAVSFPDADPL